MKSRWLGRVEFSAALALQDEIVGKKAADPGAEDELLLLEHEPVFTIGRTPDQSSLGDEAQLPHPVLKINRGGQATYHGPGQLVGYPLIDLRRRGQDLHLYLRTLEDLLIELCASYGVPTTRREGLTGVWVGERKLASIGVGVRRWVAMHGFALNVCGDLAGFSCIVPCGLTGVEMTSLAREAGKAVEVEEVASRAARLFAERLEALLPMTRGETC